MKIICWPIGEGSFVATSDSNHSFRIYPNLAKNAVLSDVNQL